MEPPVPYHPHPSLKPFHIVDTLGLDKLTPCLHLLPQPRRPCLEGICKGVFRRPDKEHRFPLDLVSPDEFPVLPQCLDGVDELNGVYVKDVLCLGMIPELLVVSGQTEDVVDPQRRCPQDIALDRNPAPVPPDHLEDRVKSPAFEDHARCEGGHPHDGGLVVRHIDRIHNSLEEFSLLPYHLRVRTSWRPALGGHHKAPP